MLCWSAYPCARPNPSVGRCYCYVTPPVVCCTLCWAVLLCWSAYPCSYYLMCSDLATGPILHFAFDLFLVVPLAAFSIRASFLLPPSKSPCWWFGVTLALSLGATHIFSQGVAHIKSPCWSFGITLALSSGATHIFSQGVAHIKSPCWCFGFTLASTLGATHIFSQGVAHTSSLGATHTFSQGVTKLPPHRAVYAALTDCIRLPRQPVVRVHVHMCTYDSAPRIPHSPSDQAACTMVPTWLCVCLCVFSQGSTPVTVLPADFIPPIPSCMRDGLTAWSASVAEPYDVRAASYNFSLGHCGFRLGAGVV